MIVVAVRRQKCIRSRWDYTLKKEWDLLQIFRVSVPCMKSVKRTNQLGSVAAVYGHEIWLVTEKIRSQVQAVDMSFLHRVAGITHCENQESLWIMRSQVRWLRNSTRTPLSRLCKAWHSLWRPRGRPRTVRRDWLGNIWEFRCTDLLSKLPQWFHNEKWKKDEHKWKKECMVICKNIYCSVCHSFISIVIFLSFITTCLYL